MAANPAWTRDELILALDIYVSSPRARQDRSDLAIAELSRILRRLPIHVDRGNADTFRNVNSVYLKLQNFKSIDPGYSGVGMRAGATPLARAIWEEFAGDSDALAAAARAIRARAG